MLTKDQISYRFSLLRCQNILAGPTIMGEGNTYLTYAKFLNVLGLTKPS